MKRFLVALIAFLCLLSIVLTSCTPGTGTSSTTTLGEESTGDMTTADNTTTTAEPEGTTAEPEGSTAEPTGTTAEPTGTTAPNVTTTLTQSTTAEPGGTTAPSGGQSGAESKPYTALESYLPAGTANIIKKTFERRAFELSKVVPYVKQGTMPYALADVKTISNGKLVSISIPVVKTGAKDQNGDLIFSIHVIGNSDAGLKGSVKRSYSIRINAEKYELPENNTEVYKFIKVDVSSYNIVLNAEETLAFFGQNDTIYPAYLFADNNSIVTLLNSQFPQATKYYNFGTSNETNGLKLSNNSLLYDFEFERTYSTKEEYDMKYNYDAVLQKVKEVYGGKYLSILGDSISTFNGINNDASANATIANNVKCYPYGDVQDYRYTYWGRLIGDTEMKLCVNNSWSGSHVVGTLNSNYASGYKDNMYDRSTELDRDSGEIPDVIFVYMGTNDLIHSKPLGELYAILETNDGRTEKQKIDAWFAGALEKASTYYGDGTKLFEKWSWDEAYALSLNAMKEKYSNAEMFCMTLLPNTNSGYNKADRAKFNRCIEALAEYFGATVIDLNEGGINENNLSIMTVDGLHPNMNGFADIEKVVVKALYKKAINK